MTLSPKEVYLQAQKAEQVANDGFYQTIKTIYEEAKADRFPAGKEDITKAFRDKVTALIRGGKSTRDAIREAHIELTRTHGVVTLNPSAADFDTQYDKFYNTLSVAIPDTQLEPKDDLKVLLQKGYAGTDGKKELGILATCPLTDQPLLATNFYVQPHINMAWFIYGGVNPTARGWGYLDVLMGAMKDKTASEFAAYHTDKGLPPITTKPIVALEMDNPFAMSAQDILYDVSRRTEALAEGESVEPIGAIDPFLRGEKYAGKDGENAKVLAALYRQPSLAGKITAKRITNVTKDKDAAELVIKYLAEELTSDDDKRKAENFLQQVEDANRRVHLRLAAQALRQDDPALTKEAALEKAREDDSYDLGSTILRLVLVTNDKTIEKARLVALVKHFFADSVLKTGNIKDVEEDVYFQAMMRSIDKIPGDIIPLQTIAEALVKPPAKDLKEMQQLAPTVLGTMSWEDIKGERGEKPLGDLLKDEPGLLKKFERSIELARPPVCNPFREAAAETGIAQQVQRRIWDGYMQAMRDIGLNVTAENVADLYDKHWQRVQAKLAEEYAGPKKYGVLSEYDTHAIGNPWVARDGVVSNAALNARIAIRNRARAAARLERA